MKDLHSTLKLVNTLLPIVGNNDTEGTPVASADRQGFNSVEHVVIFGTSGDTLSGSLKVDLKLQHSDDDSNWSPVTSADDVLIGSDSGVSAPDANGIFRTVDAAGEDAKSYRIGYRGPKRYSRVLADFTGTHTNGVPIVMLALLGHPERSPTQDK
ncbi:MAG: hypothetical protein DCC73_14975 [Proteobacteria bacterium]|nr:MAG: hypothetical protein DCC73_14975 [Pseudomonadota bacterium]